MNHEWRSTIARNWDLSMDPGRYSAKMALYPYWHWRISPRTIYNTETISFTLGVRQVLTCKTVTLHNVIAQALVTYPALTKLLLFKPVGIFPMTVNYSYFVEEIATRVWFEHNHETSILAWLCLSIGFPHCWIFGLGHCNVGRDIFLLPQSLQNRVKFLCHHFWRKSLV